MSATISLLFGLLVAIVVLATVATRLSLPYAILLVLGGLVLGFVPGLPSITLNPELILVLFLPPLIYSSAWLTSWREFRANLRPILQLALGLVLVTTIVIAIVAHTIAGLSWPVAFILGAVVSPTDAVAAPSLGRCAHRNHHHPAHALRRLSGSGCPAGVGGPGGALSRALLEPAVLALLFFQYAPASQCGLERAGFPAQRPGLSADRVTTA